MLEEAVKELLLASGDDINRSGLKDTPHRATESWRYLTQGYQKSLESIVGESLLAANNHQMIVLKNIEFYSLCEHHLLPFFGKCHIGYLPDKYILGLGKIPQIVNMYAQRLQLQENLTADIAKAILETTQAKGVGVILEAQHFCMLMRGQQTQETVLTTSQHLGCLQEPHYQKMFIELHCGKAV